MARTAVVAGTAHAVVGGMSHGGQAKEQAAIEQQAANQAAYEAQSQVADLQAQLDARQPAPIESGPKEDMTTKLKELAELHGSGAINDDEFAAAKAKLLA